MADDNDSLIRDFLTEIETIPWFSNVGESIPNGMGVEQIHGWHQWPGPEESCVSALSIQHQELYEELLAESATPQVLLNLWTRIHDSVLRCARQTVPFRDDEDAWHAPTMAVWQAAWTAGLVGLLLLVGRPPPDELKAQWQWFVQGHWPCGCADCDVNGKTGLLLVF